MSKSNLTKMVEQARAHVEQGQRVAAETYYRMILKDTDPPTSGMERLARGEACVWRAREALSQGMHGTAADWYHRAILADPLAVEYRVEYCVKALIPMGLFKNARIEAERATKIDPASAAAWRTLGGIEQALCNVEASVAAYDRQLAINPDDPNARLDRATIALDVADYATVRRMAMPALDTDRRGDAMHVLAMALYRESYHEEAIDLYREAIDAGCHDPALAEWNMALALLSINRQEEGWRAHEARGRQKTDHAIALPVNRFQAPMLKRDDARCRVHVHQEMGHGDAIAMARYIPKLLAIGHEVRVEVNDSLVDLLQRSFPMARVMPKAVDYPGALGIPPFDRHVPMLSLPAIFGAPVWKDAHRGIATNPMLVEHYKSKLPVPDGRRRIGLCWSSGIRTEGLWLAEYGRRKSIPFWRLGPLIGKLQYDVLVSLQASPERCDSMFAPGVTEVLPEKPTWDQTAALLECLDVVVTVDTAVAHLAGAMGKPTLLMMQQDGASWHFMCERPGAFWNKRSPWYPSIKIFRQREPGVWDDVVCRVTDHLFAATMQRAEDACDMA